MRLIFLKEDQVYLKGYIKANTFHNPATNTVTPQTSFNWSKLMNKDRLACIGNPEKTERNFRLFLKKWKTHCIQLFSDNTNSLFARLLNLLIVAF